MYIYIYIYIYTNLETLTFFFFFYLINKIIFLFKRELLNNFLNILYYII